MHWARGVCIPACTGQGVCISVYTGQGGVSAEGGVCPGEGRCLPGEGMSAQRECLPRGGGVCLWGDCPGGCLPMGVCLWSVYWGVPTGCVCQGDVWQTPPGTRGRHPSPSHCEQTDRKLRLRPVNICRTRLHESNYKK